jgi:hypothetical protein
VQAQRWDPNSADYGGRVRLVMTFVGLTDLSVMRLEHSANRRGTGSGMSERQGGGVRVAVSRRSMNARS